MFSEAQLYSDASFLQQRKAELMMDKYRDWFRSGPAERLLDIGSGPGIITQRLPTLLPFAKTIVGVDISKEMVSHARKEITNSKLFYYRMDITESDPMRLRDHLPLEFKHTQFDRVLCLYLLHWLAGKFQQALINVESLLAGGGKGMAIHYVSIPVFDTYVAVGQFDKWAPYLQGKVLDYNPLRLAKDPCAFMENSLRSAGLNVDDISTYSSHNVYHSASDLLGLMTSIDPFLQYIPIELQSEYMDDFLNTLLPNCSISNNGSIAIPFTIMTCAFSKSLTP